MREPDLVQRIDAEINVPDTIHVEVNMTSGFVEADFGNIYVVEDKNHVLYATTETWNSHPEHIAMRGFLYIYSDWRQDETGQNIAGIKVGDGKNYLIDIPFNDEQLYSHLNDTVSHITQEEREFWNNKVTCYISDVSENVVIFSKD